ncbi:molybdopterin-dependent oxidoreductase [Armatimonas sp.]|uniref:molybdopterin-dependent oxidoreductase n=1 Tax=Armatimonas sp. TaxID=1872638 RepID=UPI00374D3AE6
MMPLNQQPTELTQQELKRLSRRSFLWAGAGVAGSLSLLSLFNHKAKDDGTGIKQLFRTTHRSNEAIVTTLLSGYRAPEFPAARAIEPRNNYHGATPEIDTEAWRLNFGDLQLTLADLKTLPEVSLTTELKCVEGWSAIVTWTGCRFADFAKKYPPMPDSKYVYLRSEPAGFEDTWYYVGLDIESMLHPQTLLAWGMNGQPLSTEHGAPLRLAIPTKYGIKNIKLITHLSYEAERPADFWAERGYDFYAGL